MVREKGIDLRKPLIRTRGGGVRAGGGSNPSDAPAPATRYTITATSSNTSQGTVTGGGTYTEGDTVTLRATAKSGYEFTGWYSGSSKVSSNTTYTFTASQNITLVARFAEVQADFYYGAVDIPASGSHAADVANVAASLTGATISTATKTVSFSMGANKTFLLLYDETKAVPTSYAITTQIGDDTGSDFFTNTRKFYSKEGGVKVDGKTYQTVELKAGNSGSTAMPVEIVFTKQN